MLAVAFAAFDFLLFGHFTFGWAGAFFGGGFGLRFLGGLGGNEAELVGGGVEAGGGG